MDKHSVLMIDDSAFNVKVAKGVLEDTYIFYSASSAAEGLDILKKVTPNLILLDVVMPDVDGFDMLKILKADKRYSNIPVIFLTGENSTEAEVAGFEQGIVDYITKPFVPNVMKHRIASHIALADYEHHLERVIEDKISEIEEMYELISISFAGLVEQRDGVTGGHLKNTSIYFKAFTEHLCKLPKYSTTLTPSIVKKACRSAPLHDVGKIAIDDSVLRKEAKLDKEEFHKMKNHASIGGDIFAFITSKVNDKEFGTVAEQIARYHHERWDGSGYPEGLKGKEIPLVARIMSIVDVYDALTSKRSYKPQYSHIKSMALIVEGSGTQFDPELVDEFVKISDTIKNCLEAKEADQSGNNYFTY